MWHWSKWGFLYNPKQKHVALPLSCPLINTCQCTHAVYAATAIWQHVCLRNTQETLGFGHITRSTVCFLLSPVDPSQCWVPTAHSTDSCESTVNTRKRLGHCGTSPPTNRLDWQSNISSKAGFIWNEFLCQRAFTQLAFQKNKDTWSLVEEVVFFSPEMQTHTW